MKFKIIAIVLAFFGASYTYGQDAEDKGADTIPPNWLLSSTYSLNGTQTSFVNWNAGGSNNISLLGAIDASANYSKGKIKWDNDLGLALGGLMYIGKNAPSNPLLKTDDRIDFATSFGYEMKEFWYLSLLADFKSQFLEGFDPSNDSIRTSNFLAPGYNNIALGIDYTPNEHLTLFISPLAGKLTHVRDQTLADAGSFGVDPAEFDLTTGELLTPGKMFRGEFGAYLKFSYDKELFKNVEMKSKLELFSNYLENPQNIDVNAEVIFNFKVNSWLSASLNWNLIYDDDIDIRDAKGNVGPRTQFKSVIGLGISYTMKNFKEEK